MMARLLALLLGIATGGLLITAVFLADAANTAKKDANAALALVTDSTGSSGESSDQTSAGAAHNHGDAGGSTLESYAGLHPDNAAALAEQHAPFPAELPPVPDGDVVDVQ